MSSSGDLPPPLEGNGQVPEQSREEILRQIFGEIGKLIEDFSCAVESTVLLHGRMYITSKFICFYSNLFGLEKKIRIPYSHIKNVTKENTAMVIPNAIAISTDKRDYVFRSFWDREECFKTLNNYIERFRTGQSMDRPRSSSMPVEHLPEGTANLTTSLSLAAASNNGTSSSSVNTPASPPTAPATEQSPSEPANHPSESRRASRRMSTQNMPEDGFEDSESGPRADGRPGSTNLSGDAMATFTQELAKAKLKIQVVNDTIDISLKDFEALFIGENAPYSFKRYHESVKDTNVVMTPWGEPAPGLGVGREIKFFKPVNLPGLASTRGVKVQRLRKFGTIGLLLYSVTKLEDVPAADAFSVDDVIAASVVSDNKISVDISFQVTFSKSTYMRYIIDRSTNAEMTKWLEVFFQHLKKTSDLYREGKISLQAPSSPMPEEVKAAPAPAPAPESPPAEAPPAAPPSTASSLLSVMFDFTNTTLGDRMKTLLAIMLVIFLLINARLWRSTQLKIESLDATVQELQQALQTLQSALASQRGRGGL